MVIEKKNMSNLKGIAIFPFAIVRDKSDKKLVNHEKIHLRQQLEMLVIPFYIWYFTEWLIKGADNQAYRNISFERESFGNEENLSYLRTRKPYSWIKYLKPKK